MFFACDTYSMLLYSMVVFTPSLVGPSLFLVLSYFCPFLTGKTANILSLESKGPQYCDGSICTGRFDQFFSDRQHHFTIQTTSIRKNMSNGSPPQPTPYQQTFLDIANCSFDIQLYPWQYGMGGFAIQCISNNLPEDRALIYSKRNHEEVLRNI